MAWAWCMRYKVMIDRKSIKKKRGLRWNWMKRWGILWQQVSLNVCHGRYRYDTYSSRNSRKKTRNHQYKNQTNNEKNAHGWLYKKQMTFITKTHCISWFIICLSKIVQIQTILLYYVFFLKNIPKEHITWKTQCLSELTPYRT